LWEDFGAFGVERFDVLRGRAIDRLRPELGDDIRNGTLALDEAEAQVLPVWDDLVWQVIQYRS
jgi:hypothetical protein